MKSIHVHELFIIMGLIIVISFLGTTFFRKIRVPNSILLILIGIFLNIWKNPFDLNSLQSFAPSFGSFALLLILLEAGLELNIRHFLQSIGISVLFGTLSYFFGVGILISILYIFFGYTKFNALLLALVCVGCSPSILMPVLKGMNIEKKDKAFLDLECNVTEVLGLIITISIFPLILPTLSGSQVEISSLILASGNKLFKMLIIALIVPVFLGMIWSRLLSYAGEKPLWPILTIGVTLLLFGASEFFGGKGALNVLIFGLVLGNARIIKTFFVNLFGKLKLNGRIGNLFLSLFVGQHFAKVQHISREFSFFVRTFFFVYLGAIVDFSHFNWNIFLVVLVLTLLPMMVRFFLAKLIIATKILSLPPINNLVFLTPRGLANALIVFAVIDYAQHSNLLPITVINLRETLITPVFGVIIFSNLILTLYLIFKKENKTIPKTWGF